MRICMRALWTFKVLRKDMQLYKLQFCLKMHILKLFWFWHDKVLLSFHKFVLFVQINTTFKGFDFGQSTKNATTTFFKLFLHAQYRQVKLACIYNYLCVVNIVSKNILIFRRSKFNCITLNHDAIKFKSFE